MKSELTADVARGEWRPTTRATVGGYAERWLAGYQGRTSRGVRPETLSEYAHDLARFVEALGRVRLAALEPADLKRYAKSLADSGLAPGTVRRMLVPVKAMLATAAEEGAIRANPSLALRLPGPRREAGADAVRALTASELAQLVAATPDGEKRLLVRLVALTGMRVGEALAVTWGAVDTREGTVAVRQRIRAGRVDAPKTAAGFRVVPIAPALAHDLAAHRMASPHCQNDDYVFATRTGSAWGYRNALRWFAPTVERAGLADVGFHTLRHTAASAWLAAGHPVPEVARLLGHSSPQVTMSIYAHAIRDRRPDGAALASALGVT